MKTPVKILVVDDSRVARMQVSMSLAGGDYEILEAKDGDEALATIEACPDLSLVICDLNMPGKSGMDVLDAVRQRPQHDRLPFIMLTTEARLPLVQQGRRHGANGWMIKPVRKEPLLNAVQRVLVSPASAPASDGAAPSEGAGSP